LNKSYAFSIISLLGILLSWIIVMSSAYAIISPKSFSFIRVSYIHKQNNYIDNTSPYGTPLPG